MTQKTKKEFKQFLKSLSSDNSWQDMWEIYKEGYTDGVEDIVLHSKTS